MGVWTMVNYILKGMVNIEDEHMQYVHEEGLSSLESFFMDLDLATM